MPVAGEVHDALAAVVAGRTADAMESETLDFKKRGRPVADTLRDLAEAAACFANARGGSIVVGVADNRAGPDAVEGCDLDPVIVARRIYELTDPHLVISADVLRHADRPLLVITVPMSPDVHQVGGRATERIGTSCEPMTGQRIASVLAERRGEDWSSQGSGIGISAVSTSAVELARSLLEASPDPRWRAYARESTPDLLRRLALVTSDGSLTNAGALLFAPGFREQNLITYVHRRTPAGALSASEHLGGPLLPAVTRVIEMIEGRVDRTSVNLPSGQQLQLADLPEAAVREAVVNAVMHRDYRMSGPIHVEHTATRLMVSSPGPFISGITPQNVLTTSPRSRNPVLSSAIRTLGLAESAGVGVDRMYAEMARIGHRPPEFTANTVEVRVTLLGGAPNAYLARFAASLPAGEADDADTMLTLLTLLTRRTITAETMSPLLQKPRDETLTVLDRLAADPVSLIERTRETARRSRPVYRLREHVVAVLGPALSYRTRTVDEYDRKIIGMLRETGEINARIVRLILDLDASAASRVLASLVERGILVKTSQAQRGSAVTYGPGPVFPKPPVGGGQPGRDHSGR